jgi:glycosyltransferase involved in cell wall biosynthesis
MKISFIITSYNHKKRLFYSLQSAVNQKIPEGYEYEIILADDNSTDGTIEMVKEYFPTVKISLNEKSLENKFTTCSNKNTAVKLATGDRLVLSNGDIIFSSKFIESYCNPIWKDNVVFGPCERSDPKISTFLELLPMKIKDEVVNTRKLNNYKDIVTILTYNNWIQPDPHHDKSVYTYNQEFSYIHPWGGNMSVLREHYNEVEGFPELLYYGGEERELVRKIVDKFNVKVVSNNKSYSIHLWHPQYNTEGKEIREEYQL